jgi:Zn finger protein HypA/HybF involved in hydrogenase expression
MGLLKLLKLVIKASVKNKLRGLGVTLTPLERILLFNLNKLPDRVATILAVANIHPQFVDPSVSWVDLLDDVDKNVELTKKLYQRYPVDNLTMLYWGGPLLSSGLYEMGVPFQLTEWNYPTNTDNIIKVADDLHTIHPPDIEGYFETALQVFCQAQDELPSIMISPFLTSTFTLGCFLRSTELLLEDLKCYQRYTLADTERERQQIEDYCHRLGSYPNFFEDEMTHYSQLVLTTLQRYKEYGIDPTGCVFWELYASPPSLDIEEFLTYVYPYIYNLYTSVKRYHPLGITYYPDSVERWKTLFDHAANDKQYLPTISLPSAITFPIASNGDLECDHQAMIQLCKTYNQPYTATILPYFLRDANKQEIYQKVKELVERAVQAQLPTMISPVAVTNDTDPEKVDTFFQAVCDHGNYTSPTRYHIISKQQLLSCPNCHKPTQLNYGERKLYCPSCHYTARFAGDELMDYAVIFHEHN